MNEPSFFFCRVYRPDGKLLAYWYLSKPERYRLAYKIAEGQHTVSFFDAPEQAVEYFYRTFIDHLLAIRNRLEFQVKLSHGAVKPPPGFRAKAYTKEDKERAIERYNAFFREARRDLAREIQRLREKNWPTPPMKQLPWEEDYYAVASVAAERTKHISSAWALSRKVHSLQAGGNDTPDPAREAALQVGEKIFPELRLGSLTPVFKIDVR